MSRPRSTLPYHLQQKHHFQSHISKFYAIGLTSHAQFSEIFLHDPQRQHIARLLNEKDPEGRSPFMTWTFSGAEDVSEIFHQFGDIEEVFCGMFFTVLLIRNRDTSNRRSKRRITRHLRILTNRTDIFGEDLVLENVDEVNVGLFDVVARRGKKLFHLGRMPLEGNHAARMMHGNDDPVDYENDHITNPQWCQIPVAFNPSLNETRRAFEVEIAPDSILQIPTITIQNVLSEGDSPIASPPLSPRNSTFQEAEQWQSMTIENTKKRDSPIGFLTLRSDVLKPKFQSSNVTVDKDVSHIKQIQDLLPMYIQKLSSYSLEQKLTGATNIRMILARDENHSMSVSRFIDGAGLTSCLRYLNHPDEQLVTEVIWILICVSVSETAEHAESILTEENMNHLKTILEASENDTLLELVVQLVGNLCAHEESAVDRRVFLPHIMQVMQYSPPPSLQRMCAWAISNIVRVTAHNDAKLALPTLSFNVEEHDMTDSIVLRDTCRGLYYLSWNLKSAQRSFPNEVEDEVIGGLIQTCRAYIQVDGNAVHDTLKTLGNIIASPINVHTERCLEKGLLDLLTELLAIVATEGEDLFYPGIILDLCWIISNVACSSAGCIDQLLETKLLGALIALTFENEDQSVHREIAYTFANVISCCRLQQRQQLLDYEPIDFMSHFLEAQDTKLVLLILESYRDLMDVGIRIPEEVVDVVRQVSERHPSAQVYKRGQAIVESDMKRKQWGDGPEQRRLLKLPPKPKPTPVPDVYCTSSAIFIVYGRGEQMWACGNALCLGIGDYSDRDILIPQLVDVSMFDSPIVQIAGGEEHTLVLCESGSVYAAGSNAHGCCGTDKWSAKHATFSKIRFPDPNLLVIKIACGTRHSVFLSAFNTVFVCGEGTNGKLGLGHKSSQAKAQQLRQMTEVKEVFAGSESTGVVRSNEDILMCGSGAFGSLGMRATYGQAHMPNISSYPRLTKMDSLPPKDTLHTLLESKHRRGGFHMVIWQEYEYSFEERLHFCLQEEEYTDMIVVLKRLDSSTTTLTLREDLEFEVPNHLYATLFSKEESLHYRLKFVAELIDLSFDTGCLPPENEDAAKYQKPLPGLSFWDNEKVTLVCNWILKHFPELQSFSMVRKEMGEAASAWRRKNGNQLRPKEESTAVKVQST